MNGVLFVDSNTEWMQELVQELNREFGFDICVAASEQEAVSHLDTRNISLLLMELNDLDLSNPDFLDLAMKRDWDLKVGVYTDKTFIPLLNRLLDAGVCGFIKKQGGAENWAHSIRCVLRGEAILPVEWLRQIRRQEIILSVKDRGGAPRTITLTMRDQEILQLIGLGIGNKQLAELIHVSQRTLENNLTSIYRQLGVSNRIEAIVAAGELGIISPITNSGMNGRIPAFI